MENMSEKKITTSESDNAALQSNVASEPIRQVIHKNMMERCEEDSWAFHNWENLVRETRYSVATESDGSSSRVRFPIPENLEVVQNDNAFLENNKKSRNQNRQAPRGHQTEVRFPIPENHNHEVVQNGRQFSENNQESRDQNRQAPRGHPTEAPVISPISRRELQRLANSKRVETPHHQGYPQWPSPAPVISSMTRREIQEMVEQQKRKNGNHQEHPGNLRMPYRSAYQGSRDSLERHLYERGFRDSSPVFETVEKDGEKMVIIREKDLEEKLNKAFMRGWYVGRFNK